MNNEELTERLMNNLPMWISMVDERRTRMMRMADLAAGEPTCFLDRLGHDAGDEDPNAWS